MSIQELIDSQRYPAQANDNRSKLLPEVLRDAARQPQQQSHLRCGSRRLSWAEIDLLSDRFAAALLERGVRVGDRVAVVLPNSVEFVIACFAIWKARAIAVPEDISIRPVSLQFILEQTQPTALLLDGRLAEQLQRMPQALGSVRTLFLKDCAGAPSGLAGIAIESLDAVLQSEAPAQVLPTGARVDEVVSINYTSGSTGVPKGVMHTHESWLAGAAFTRDYVGVSANDVMVIPLPLHHTYAFRQILAYLLAKGSVVIAADIYSALNLIPEQRPTALLLVPAACNILIDHFASVLHQADGILRYIEIGTGAMTPERLNCLRELLPHTQIHLPYGLTEGRVGYLKPGPDGLVNRLTSCSLALQVQVVDRQGQPVAREQTGEIVLKGQGLMKGYFGEPEATQERLRSQGFRTRDMGRVDASGEIVLLGRVDDILKVAGHKINPLEVEATLNHHPAVAESAVLGLPDPRGILELELHAFVVLRKSAAPTPSELLVYCRQYLEPYKVPQEIHFCTSFPKSSLGKIQRQLFAEQAQEFTSKKENAMQVLISPTSLEEAASILDTDVDIIDVKNVNEGSLGAQFPWHTRAVVELVRPRGIKTSATLGDLPYKPGTAALAAYGAAHCGVSYIKAGLHGLNTYEQARDMMEAVRRAVHMVGDHIDVVAAGYADYRRFNGLNPSDLVRAARDARCDVVMVDTAIKDGNTLFDAMSPEEIREFIGQGHEAGLKVALAGSLKSAHVEVLLDLGPDIIGVRGAVCEGKDRKTCISPEKTRQFVQQFHEAASAMRPATTTAGTFSAEPAAD